MMPAVLPPPFLFSFPKVIPPSSVLESYSAMVSSLVSEFKLTWVHLLAPPLSNYMILDNLFNLTRTQFPDLQKGTIIVSIS